MKHALVLALAIVFIFPSQNLQAQQNACLGGMAGIYPCSNIDLMAQRGIDWLNTPAVQGNDIWGWTDPLDGREYVLMGTRQSMVVVDITSAVNPELVFRVQTQSSSSSWRDIKVYQDHAFIVSEAVDHGMQVVDLTNVRTADRNVVPDILPVAVYTEISKVHNLVINEDTGFAYAVGTNGASGTTCSGGLHAIDIRIPTDPKFAGCFSADGYTHDAQCVVYSGPDTEHQGKEICIASNTDTITIVDFTTKSAPVQISRTGYATSQYTHQGWFTDDQVYFLSNDELDERRGQAFTRTFIWDLTDLDNPVSSIFTHATPAIDHNLYIQKDYVFMANYNVGLRTFKIDRTALLSNSLAGELDPIGFFDTVPGSDAASFGGSWSSYPYFCSGNIPISNMGEGLFIVRPNDQGFISDSCPTQLNVEQGPFEARVDDDAIHLAWTTLAENDNIGFDIEFAEGDHQLEKIAFIEGQLNSSSQSDYTYRIPIDGPGEYKVRLKDIDTGGNHSYWPSQILSVEIPGDRIVYPAHPNPFSSTTRVRFATTDNQWVTAKLFNSIGKEVQVVFRGLSPGGTTHSFEIDGSNLPSGVYLINIVGNTFSDTKLITLNK